MSSHPPSPPLTHTIHSAVTASLEQLCRQFPRLEFKQPRFGPLIFILLFIYFLYIIHNSHTHCIHITAAKKITFQLLS